MYTRANEPGSGWDTSDAPNSWYGAGAISMSGPNNYVTVGATSATNVMPVAEMPKVPGRDNTEGKKPNIWYSLNGKIRAVNVPKITKEKPTPPVAPTEPQAPTYEEEKPLEPAPVVPTYEKSQLHQLRLQINRSRQNRKSQHMRQRNHRSQHQ